MTEDPFFKHKKLFFWSVFTLVVALCLLGFSLYIFPHVFLGFNYGVPSFIYDMAQWYRFYYRLTGISLSLALFLPFFIPGLIFAYIVKVIDGYMDKEAERLAAIHGTKPEKPGMDPQTVVASLKAIVLAGVIVVTIYLLLTFLLPTTVDSI